MKFSSKFIKIGEVTLPIFSNTRIMMMPVVIGDPASLPPELAHYIKTFGDLSPEKHKGEVGYLTIDEKPVPAASTHRRPGLHVDGVYRGLGGGWGGSGAWGSPGNGMITVASHAGCRAWDQQFSGIPDAEGGCEHLRGQLVGPGRTFSGGEVFWLDGMCVHESLPMNEATPRQFVRLSLPSTAPWFEGYSTNSRGVLPTGAILPPRTEFMSQ